jgi:sugar phosphate isomerase/epimerase
MSTEHSHSNFPKLHNAMWPGLVGKGSPGAEPCIDLDTMLDLTAGAEVDGIKFDGVDLFLFEPHIDIGVDDDGIKQLADKIQSRGFVVGSVVAPVWPPTGGGSAMGNDEERHRFIQQVRLACRIGRKLRDLGVRPHGIVRIDSACSVGDWTQDAEANQRKIVETLTQACDVAEQFGERLAAEGEICWGGMHSWKKMLDLLERVNRPQTLGFQADMAHTLLYILGYNAPEDAILPSDWDWSDPQRLDEAMKTLTNALRPWTIDFHVAQNDATVKGSGTHDNTGHHCLPDDPEGKLAIPHHAGYWLHGEDGQLTRACQHICWDGCMFPNAVMMQQDTWNHILAAMIAVRDAHGWREDEDEEETESVEAIADVAAVQIETGANSDQAPKQRKPKKAAKRVSSKARKKSSPAKKKSGAKPKRAAAKAAAKAKKKKSKPAKKAKTKPKGKTKQRMKTKPRKANSAKKSTKSKRPAAKKTSKKR